MIIPEWRNDPAKKCIASACRDPLAGGRDLRRATTEKPRPCERGQLVASQLERSAAHLLRQPSFVISIGVLNLRAVRSRALVSRAGNGKLLDGGPKANLYAGRFLDRADHGKRDARQQIAHVGRVVDQEFERLEGVQAPGVAVPRVAAGRRDAPQDQLRFRVRPPGSRSLLLDEGASPAGGASY